MLPILLVAEEYPGDIADGLNEIAQHYIHQNFKTSNTIIDDGIAYEYKWGIK